MEERQVEIQRLQTRSKARARDRAGEAADRRRERARTPPSVFPADPGPGRQACTPAPAPRNLSEPPRLSLGLHERQDIPLAARALDATASRSTDGVRQSPHSAHALLPPPVAAAHFIESAGRERAGGGTPPHRHGVPTRRRGPPRASGSRRRRRRRAVSHTPSPPLQVWRAGARTHVGAPRPYLDVPHDEPVLVVQELDPDLRHLATRAGAADDLHHDRELDRGVLRRR